MSIIYGVDTTKPVSVYDIRDAIVECFMLAHREVLDDLKNYTEKISDIEFENIKIIDIKQLMRTYFTDVGGDFENPTKESIMKVIGKLKEYAINFRNPEIIRKHSLEIMELVNCLK